MSRPVIGRLPTVMSPEERQAWIEKIAKAYKVPYWIVYGLSRPRWRDRPIWRVRALWWRWFV